MQAQRLTNRNSDPGLEQLHAHLARLGAPSTATAVAIDPNHRDHHRRPTQTPRDRSRQRRRARRTRPHL